jgi:hypothetical protein
MALCYGELGQLHLAALSSNSIAPSKLLFCLKVMVLLYTYMVSHPEGQLASDVMY